MITSSSRGRLSCLIAFPRIISDWPFEYTYDTHMVSKTASFPSINTYVGGVEGSDTMLVTIPLHMSTMIEEIARLGKRTRT